jgi:protein-S-isoprenylcysteine O-methyltransferase Ste14
MRDIWDSAYRVPGIMNRRRPVIQHIIRHPAYFSTAINFVGLDLIVAHVDMLFELMMIHTIYQCGLIIKPTNQVCVRSGICCAITFHAEIVAGL